MNEHDDRTARTAQLVQQLLAVVQELEDMHPGRKFPLDGHLVGSIGEAAAEATFAITLAMASTAGYDAVTADGRKVEIKATFGGESVAVRPTSGKYAGSALIVLRLSKMPGVAHEVVYNGPFADALQIAGATQPNGQALMRLAGLRALNDSVPDEKRVPGRNRGQPRRMRVREALAMSSGLSRGPEPQEERGDAAWKLAGLLGVDSQRLLRAAGGPWDAVEQRRNSDDADPDVPGDLHPGWLFVGRGGPSVAIRVEPATRAVTVGPADGTWEGVASLRWLVGEPRAVLALPSAGLAQAEFLDQLRSAVDAAAATKTSTLMVCRYCGVLTGPEHALDAETCHACGRVVFGVVY